MSVLREQLKVSAQHWEAHRRAGGMLWRDREFARLQKWMRSSFSGVLSEREVAFIEACRQLAQRTMRVRYGLGLAAAMIAAGLVFGGFYFKATTETRLARQSTEAIKTQSHVEQGRAAGLYGNSRDAQRHLLEAYRRGDHSPPTTFMLERALQPVVAERARFAPTLGRMWSAVYSPDGRQIVTTDDRAAQIWDAKTNRLLFTLPHDGNVYHAVYSADGETIVTAANDGRVRVWRAADGSLVRELERRDGRRPRYYLLALSRVGSLVAAVDTPGEITDVWNIDTGESVASLRNLAAGFSSIAFSSDGRWLAVSAGEDARVFDTRTWSQVLSLTGPIRSLSFDPSGPRLATGTAGGEVAVWSIPSGGRVRHLRQIGESVDRVAWSPDGELVAAASHDGAQQVWHTSGELRGQANYLHSIIQALEFDVTSKFLLAAGVDGVVVVADVGLSTPPVSMLEGPRNAVRTAHFDPSSRRILGASWDGARVWDATPAYRRWGSLPVKDACDVATSLVPDQRFIAVACRDRSTRIWDTQNDRLLAELPAMTEVGDAVPALPAVSSGGDRAAIARDGAVEVYELPGRRLLRAIRHGAPVSAIGFSPTGHDVITGAADGTLFITQDGREPIALPAAEGRIDAALILADGRILAAHDRSIRVIDANGAVIAELASPTRTGLLRPDPDGARLVAIPIHTGAAAAPVLWDLRRYSVVAQLDEYIGRVYTARFVRDGREVLTAGGDGIARRWDSTTGQHLMSYEGGSRYLADATLTPDGSMLAAVGGDGMLRFWDVPSGRLLWALQVHRSAAIGIHCEGEDIVTRGFGGDVSRWKFPAPGSVIDAFTSTKQ